MTIEDIIREAKKKEDKQDELRREEEKEIRRQRIREEGYSDDDLPFAYAEIVRLMKENLDSDKIIRERVKIEMNKFLGRILIEICQQLNTYPYSSIEYDMFRECIYPYINIRNINNERDKILLQLKTIKTECDNLSANVKSTMKLKEGNHNDYFQDDFKF